MSCTTYTYTYSYPYIRETQACMHMHCCYTTRVQTESKIYSRIAQVFSVRAFYDGQGQFIARFMPPATGVWGFVSRSSTTSALNGDSLPYPNLKLNPGPDPKIPAPTKGLRGNFTVVSPSPSNHGPVVAAPNSTKFIYADGPGWDWRKGWC